MKNLLKGKGKLNNPAGNKLQNPLVSGKKAKGLSKMHTDNLRKSGAQEPKSPLE